MTDHQTTARTRFANLALGPERDIDLATACLLIAVEEYGPLDVDAYLSRLESLAARATSHIDDRSEPFEVVHGINTVLFEEQGFSGNREGYYDPRNSYLCDVMDRRTGNPILLSILYNEIARRVGHELAPVGLPGHFMLRVGKDDQALYVDAFDRGGLLTRSECKRLVGRITGRNKPLERYFRPLGRRAVLARVLNNLKLVYLKEQRHAKALAAAERIEIVAPGAWENIGDIARLQTDMGDYPAAAESLSRYLALAPQDRDTSSAKAALEAIRNTGGAPDDAD